MLEETHRGDRIAHASHATPPQLTLLALVALGGVVAFLGLASASEAGWRAPLVLGPLAFTALGAIGLLGVSRLSLLSVSAQTTAGLAFGVLVAACIAIIAAHYAWAAPGSRGGVSPVAVWALIVPLLVPAKRLLVIGATVAAVAADPVALLATGGAWPAATATALWLLPHALAVAGAAWLGSDAAAVEEEGSGDIGNYSLIELLAEGGMGEVWRAEHRLLKRPAAIKLIKLTGPEGGPAPDSTLVLKRFEREVRATAKMRSPHTVQIYDYGTVGDGSFYYAMELLDGIDLFALVARWGAQPAERVVHILRQACESLYEAHENGLVHRDVKPGNLLVCRWTDRLDFVKVVDFGFVIEKGGGDPRATRLTRHGMAPGTPAFMAPEIARGRRDVDGRSDIYALGCVAYWLLTGRVVFERPTSAMMLVAHVKDEPSPPSEKAYQTIPPELDAIILDCLAKEPDSRPETARELSRRLAEIDIEKLWTAERKEKWWSEARPPGSRRN